jgi:allantoicase
MATYFTSARDPFHNRIIVDVAIHRIRASIFRDGAIKRVPVYGLAFVDTGKDYRGRLGAKDKARHAAALAANG